MIHQPNKTPVNFGSFLLGAFFLYLLLPKRHEPEPQLTPEQKRAQWEDSQLSDGVSLMLWFTVGLGCAIFVAFTMWFVYPLLGVVVMWLYVIGSVKLVEKRRNSKSSELKQYNPPQIIFRAPPWITSRTDEMKNIPNQR
jgi:hypothetical protein